jgi:hypothetical protein
LNSRDKTGRTGSPGQDYLNRTARKIISLTKGYRKILQYLTIASELWKNSCFDRTVR